jgi:spermidine synthase
VLAAARSLFGLPTECERLAIELEDGAKWVPAHTDCIDVLLLDAFDDGRSVKALATQAFYEAYRKTLRSRGIMVVNFIAEERGFGKYLARIEEAFDGRVLCLPAQDRVNMIVLAFKGGPARVAIESLKGSARVLKRRYALPFDRFVTDLLELNTRTAAYLRIGRP